MFFKLLWANWFWKFAESLLSYNLSPPHLISIHRRILVVVIIVLVESSYVLLLILANISSIRSVSHMTSKAWLISVWVLSHTRSGPILIESSGYLTAIWVCPRCSWGVVALSILLCLGCELWLLILLIRTIHLHIGILWAICWCIWRWHTIHIYVIGLINSLVHGWL
jgi:hypothetical protein